MIERKGGNRARTSSVIVRSNRNGVFSDLVTPGGGSVKVMSREVYVKATQAARAAFLEGADEKSNRDLTIGTIALTNKRTTEERLTPTSKVIAGKPLKSL